MKKSFWDRTAKIYDRFMRKDRKAYEQMWNTRRNWCQRLSRYTEPLNIGKAVTTSKALRLEA